MSNYEMMNGIIATFSGENRKITINRIYLEITKDYPCAAFLDQLIYWSDKSSRNDGFFYKKYEEWREELLLSDYQIRRATKKLKEMGFVETSLKKANGTPVTHYKVNMDAVREAIVKELNNRKLTNSTFENKETQYSLECKETKQSLTEDYNITSQQKNTTDNVSQALSLLFDNFITISQKTKSEIEFSLEDIGENAYDITQLAINYTKQQNKGINYLKAILNNWSKEKVKTVEQAQEKLSPNQRKTKQQQKSEEKNSFWENKLKGVSGNEW